MPEMRGDEENASLVIPALLVSFPSQLQLLPLEN